MVPFLNEGKRIRVVIILYEISKAGKQIGNGINRSGSSGERKTGRFLCLLKSQPGSEEKGLRDALPFKRKGVNDEKATMPVTVEDTIETITRENGG